MVGKGGWCVGLTTLPPSCVDCLEIFVSTGWHPQALYLVWTGIALPLPFPPPSSFLLE